MNKKLLVLIKICDGDTNPFDESSLEVALSLPGYEVHTLTMGPLSNKARLEDITRLGVTPHLISDTALAGSDSLITAKVLSTFIRQLQPDLVFAGIKSIDGDTGQVPIMISEMIGYALVSSIVSFASNKVITREGVTHEFRDKMLCTFGRIKTLRFPRMMSKKQEVEIINVTQLKINKECVGIKASPTRVIRTYENNTGKRKCKFITADELYGLLTSGKEAKEVWKKYSGEKTALIHYVGDIKSIADEFASKSMEIKYIANVGAFIKSIPEDAKIILFENNSACKELAARVAARKQYGLTADCTGFSFAGNLFVMTRPAYGGNVIANIVSSSPIVLASVSKHKKTSGIIFCVGRGAITYLEQIRHLAAKYNAEIVSTRPVVDGGYISYPNQVGLTGKSVAPRIYVAFGVSGQIQHMICTLKSDIIVAINSSKEAPIFEYADYGILSDIKEIIKEI